MTVFSFSKNINIKAVIVTSAALLIIGLGASALTQTWDFSDSSQYIYDAGAVEISGGSVSLLTKDQTDDANDAAGFGGGQFSNTAWESGNTSLELNGAGKTAGSGTFTSRILDAGGVVDWTSLDWIGGTPIGKELPDNGATETGYADANVNMSDNLLLMHLNESSGATSFADTSGQGNSAVCTASDCPTAGQDGIFESAPLFDGAGDVIESNSTNYVFGGEITLMAWFKFDGAGSGAPRILEISKNGDANSHALAPDRDGSVRAWAECSNGARVGAADDSTQYDDGEWHHFAYTYDSPAGTIYIDGVATDTGTSSCSDLDDGDELAIGSISDASGQYNHSQHSFDGYIDEPAVFDTALSASTIEDIYERGLGNVQFQVRACDDVNCIGESFVGPDGTTNTYFDDATATTTAATAFTLDGFSDQFFQYQATLNTDDSSLTPSVKEVSVGPNHYDAGSPSIQNTNPVDITNTSAFAHTLGAGNEGRVTYQLSSDGTDWWYLAGGNWTIANGSENSSTATQVNGNVDTFATEVGADVQYMKAFLNSAAGTEQVKLNAVSVTHAEAVGEEAPVVVPEEPALEAPVETPTETVEEVPDVSENIFSIPETPSSLQTKKRRAKSVKLEWDGSGAYYKVQVKNVKTRKPIGAKSFLCFTPNLTKKCFGHDANNRAYKPNTEYKFRVKTCNFNGECSDYSAYTTFRTKPGKVKKIKVKNKSGKFQFTPIRGDGIEYEIKVLNKQKQTVATITTSKTTGFLPFRPKKNKHIIRVRAMYTGDAESQSDGLWNRVQPGTRASAI